MRRCPIRGRGAWGSPSARRQRSPGFVRLYFNVSGGGYIAGALTAGLAQAGAVAARHCPFGDGVEDSPAVAHLRDYSNYVLPRGRSAVANWADVVAILARGLVGNAIPVSATIHLLALITVFAYSRVRRFDEGRVSAEPPRSVLEGARCPSECRTAAAAPELLYPGIGPSRRSRR